MACLSFTLSAQWQPAGSRIKTKWASQIDVNNVLPEYPRPIMKRAEWQNLNGLWNYAILPVGQKEPTKYDGQILVPFAVESSLSGTQKEVTDEYVKYAEEFKQLIREGFSAAIYTQTTDVEIEVNGLMTYDREIIKVDESQVRKINQEICNILKD